MNRLANESSPYLRQHAHNPVDWFPWGEEAFAKARAENKPIFLSIGYSTCHWCHVMERESFVHEEIAGLLNAFFVAIKVDREERPDLDHIYMTAVQATTGHGGWPMSVWLTPDRQPFYCGTYFQPHMFIAVLNRIHEVWETNHDGVVGQASQITDAIREHLATGKPGALDAEALRDGVKWFRQTYDRVHGGFGGAPKFPRPVVFNFLLRGEGRDMALHTLWQMGQGGLFDQLGGGFHRYSVDERWLVSHFEKMLYDQAQLVVSYCEAYQLTGDPFFADIAQRTCAYVLRDLTSPDGAFYSAEDADSEGVEGKFYVWTRAEIETVLGDRADAFCRAYGVTGEGNWEDGQNVLHVTDLNTGDRETLLAARAKRIRPHRDEKVLTSWNGLMITALCRAGLVAPAARAAKYLLAHRWREGQLFRTETIPGMLDDYANFGLGLLDLHEQTLETAWLTAAGELADALVRLFGDELGGGFFQTDGTDPSVLIRAKDNYDGAEPSGNAQAMLLLLRLGRADLAARSLAAFGETMQNMPHAVPQMLCALDWHLHGPVTVAVDASRALLPVVHECYVPNRVVRLDAVLPAGAAQVCRGQVCQLPVTEPAALRTLLKVS
jgi:uncharacterized protein YyaL (SSP411 family)